MEYMCVLGSKSTSTSRINGRIKSGAEGIAFDEIPMPDLSLTDIDFSIQVFSEKRMSINEEALITLKLLTHTKEGLCRLKEPSSIWKTPPQYFSDAWIQCGRFVGSDKATIFDHIDIHDQLPIALTVLFCF